MELIADYGKLSIYFGLSTEYKPVGDFATGTMIVELDTGKIIYYNESTESWAEFGGASNG